MDPEATDEVSRLFQQAADLEPAARAAFLDRACAGDRRHRFPGSDACGDQGSTAGRCPGILVDVHSGRLLCQLGRLATTSFAECSRMDHLLTLHTSIVLPR